MCHPVDGGLLQQVPYRFAWNLPGGTAADIYGDRATRPARFAWFAPRKCIANWHVVVPYTAGGAGSRLSSPPLPCQLAARKRLSPGHLLHKKRTPAREWGEAFVAKMKLWAM